MEILSSPQSGLAGDSPDGPGWEKGGGNWGAPFPGRQSRCSFALGYCHCAPTGRLGLGWRPDRYGFEIDARYAETSDDVTRVIANCVKCWEILDDLFADLRFDCQVANPPFGIRWKTRAGPADSTLHTWAKIGHVRRDPAPLAQSGPGHATSQS